MTEEFRIQRFTNPTDVTVVHPGDEPPPTGLAVGSEGVWRDGVKVGIKARYQIGRPDMRKPYADRVRPAERRSRLNHPPRGAAESSPTKMLSEVYDLHGCRMDVVRATVQLVGVISNPHGEFVAQHRRVRRGQLIVKELVMEPGKPDVGFRPSWLMRR